MKKETTDRLIGISAILISLLTLIIFIYQTNIIHKQSRLSVTPRIGFQSSFNQMDSIISYNLTIQNKGIGPAIINSAILELKGKEYSADLDKFFDTNFPKISDYGHLGYTSTLDEGSTLASNEEKLLFSYSFQQRNMQELMQYLNLKNEDSLPFNVEVIYSSIYDEKWYVDTNNTRHPKKM